MGCRAPARADPVRGAGARGHPHLDPERAALRQNVPLSNVAQGPPRSLRRRHQAPGTTAMKNTLWLNYNIIWQPKVCATGALLMAHQWRTMAHPPTAAPRNSL